MRTLVGTPDPEEPEPRDQRPIVWLMTKTTTANTASVRVPSMQTTFTVNTETWVCST